MPEYLKKPEAHMGMRKNELSPAIREYIDNLTEQIHTIVTDLGYSSLQEMDAAINPDNPETFEKNTIKRERIFTAVEKLSELAAVRKHAKETGRWSIPAVEFFDREEFDPTEYKGYEKSEHSFLAQYVHQIRAGHVEVMNVLGGGFRGRELAEQLTDQDIRMDTFLNKIVQEETFLPLEKPHTETLASIVFSPGFYIPPGDKNGLVSLETIFEYLREQGLAPCSVTAAMQFRMLSNNERRQNDKPLYVFSEPVGKKNEEHYLYLNQHKHGMFLSSTVITKTVSRDKAIRVLVQLEKKEASKEPT